jgi:hypothetical protein
MLRRLFTHEDKTQIHKSLGIGCLIHFVYRLVNTSGTLGFLPNRFTAICLAMHIALHVSSFQFILPQKRNFTYNTIFPENRLHTMIFAYRALLVMIIRIYFPSLKFLCGIVVLFSMIFADMVTSYYKKITNNGTSIRNNPYPKSLSIYSKQINLFYAFSQIGATTFILYGTENEAFLTLIPIQLASFLMTLEKKGFINQLGWHVGYSFALFINYYWRIVYGTIDPDIKYIPNLVILFVSIGRLYFGIDKYILWALPIIFYLK